MNKDSISIFDISLLVDSVCCTLSSQDIVRCRKVCKAWNAAFASNEWLSVGLYEQTGLHSRKPRPAVNHQRIRDNAQWIRSLRISLFDTSLQDSSCINLQRLVCVYSKDLWKEPAEEECSLALLWRNRRLKDLEVDFYDSHVRRHMLPNLPRLTNLQRLKLRIKHTWMCDVDLFLDALQCLPLSLQELDLQVLDWKQGEFSNTPATPPRAWTTRAIRRFTLNHAFCGTELSFLIPFLTTCPLLERLSLSDISSNYADELMGTLASACPRLSWLELDSRNGTECLYFAQLHQKFSSLTLDVSTDTRNVAVPAILSHSTVTLRELRLKNASWVPSLDIAMILRTCAELRVLQVDAYSIPTGRSRASITLQDLVESPWASTHLLIVNLAVTDARDIAMVEDEDEDEDEDKNEDDERKETARLVLLLQQQIQSLKNFSRYSLFSFSGQRFFAMPLQNPLRYLNARMAECDLRILRAMAFGDGFETMPQHVEINTTRWT